MNYQRDLQVRLQERYRRLYKAGDALFKTEAGYLIDFIRATPALRYLMENVERSASEIDPAKWITEHVTWQTVSWPPTETGRAKVAWHLLQEWSQADHGAAMFGMTLHSCRTTRMQDADVDRSGGGTVYRVPAGGQWRSI